MKGWYGNKMAHGLASRGIKTRMRVGFSNIGGLLGDIPNSKEDIYRIRDQMIDAKEHNDINALYQAVLRIIPTSTDPDSNIEYIYKDNSIFSHPDNQEEFQKLFDQLAYFKKIDDIDGVYITALQLLPDEVKEVYTEDIISDDELQGLKEDINMAKGWYGKSKEHSLASKGVRTKNGTKLIWTNVESLREGYEGIPTGTLVKKAENLDNLIGRRRVHPKGLSNERKEEYIDNVNNLQAMILELDRRGVDF